MARLTCFHITIDLVTGLRVPRLDTLERKSVGLPLPSPQESLALSVPVERIILEAFAQQGPGKNMKTVACGGGAFVCGFGWVGAVSANSSATGKSLVG